jgi:hypothetical protein
LTFFSKGGAKNEGVVQYGTVQYSTDTVRYNTIQYSEEYYYRILQNSKLYKTATFPFKSKEGGIKRRRDSQYYCFLNSMPYSVRNITFSSNIWFHFAT